MLKTLTVAAAATLFATVAWAAEPLPCDVFIPLLKQKCAEEREGLSMCAFAVEMGDDWWKVEFFPRPYPLGTAGKPRPHDEMIFITRHNNFNLTDEHADGVIDKGPFVPLGSRSRSFSELQTIYQDTCAELIPVFESPSQ